jgi:hypothetical protein
VGALTDFLTSNRIGAAIGNTLTKKVAPVVADVFNSPLGSIIKGADKAFETVVRDPVGTVNLAAAYTQRKEFDKVKQAYKATDRISYGEATAYNLAQTFKGFNSLTNPVIKAAGGQQALDKAYELMPLLNPDYDVMDEKQRQAAQDSPYYQIATGLTDIGLEYLTSFGTGFLLKGVREAAQLTRAPLTAETIATLEKDAFKGVDDIATQLNNGTSIDEIVPSNGISVHILDMYKKNDPLELLSNPVVARSSNPRLLSQLGAATKSIEEARDVVLADLGSVAAANRLRATAPSFEDGLNLSKQRIDLQKELTPEDPLVPDKIVDAAEGDQLRNVLDDIIARNPNLTNEWQDWYSKVSIGGGNVSWAPSKFSFVEQLNKAKTSLKTERLLGKGSKQINETIIGGGEFRPFRVLTLASTRLRPRNYVEMTGLSPTDSIDELSAGLQMSSILRQAKYADFRANAIKTWLAAPADEPSRTIILKQIERDAVQTMANDIAEKIGLKVDNIDIDTPMQNVINKRDGIREKIKNTQNGIIAKEAEGAEVTAVDENMKVKLASNIPMLDMRVMEDVLNAQLRNSSVLSPRGIKAKLSTLSISADAFERAFSAAVLIRPGYIPKNSMFEPFVRILGRMHDATLPQIYGKEKFTTRVIDLDDKGNEIVPLTSAQNELVKQARQFDNFEDFSKAVSLGGLRPRVWHITKEPNFTPDVNFKPMNRLGGTSEEPVLFAGDPSFWKDYASGRKVVVEYDITNLQLNKDFYFDQSGNQGIYILPSAYSKLTKVKELSVDEAIKRAKKQQIEMPQSKNQAKAIWNKAKLNVAIAGEPSFVSKQLDVMGEDVIGGGALRQEIDPSLTLANVTQPGVFERTSRKSFTTTPVNPNLTTINPKLIKKYWGEYSQQIQVMKNDPIVGRIMSGLSDADIVKYMMRDLQQRGNFSDFYRLAAERAIARKDRTPDLSTNGAIEILNDSKAIVDNLVPDKAIQKKIIDDREIFTAKKAESLLKGKEVPTLDISLDSLPGMLSASDIALGYQKLINAGFRAIAKPESSLFRSPYGRYYGNQAVKLIVENAQRNGIEITSDMWQNQIRPIAQEYAYKQVNDTFYSIRRMNNVQYYSRFLLGFPNAMFNSIKFWVKAGFANPYNFALLEQIRTSPWAVGMVVDEDGNKISYEEADAQNKSAYLVLPFFNKPAKAQPFVYKMNTNQLNFLTNGPSPNWIGQVSLNTAVQNFPNLETKIKNTVGEKLYNQLIFGGVPRGIVPAAKDTEGTSGIQVLSSFASNVIEQVFVAGSLRSAIELFDLGYDVIFNKEKIQFRKDAVASTLWSIHTARRMDWELNNPDNSEPDIDKSIDLTLNLMFWRLVRKLFSPASVTDQPTSIMYRDEFDRLELNYVNNPQLLADRPGVAPYQAAVQDFIMMYGEEAVRNLITGTKYKTSIAPEQIAAGRLKSYDWLQKWAGENPDSRVPVVGMVLNPVVPGDYSPAASANLKISTVGGVPIFEGTKTFAEREADARIEDGWREYDRITKERDSYLAGRPSKSLTANSNSDIRAWYRDQLYNEADGLAVRNPQWVETFGNTSDTFTEGLNLINVALDNEKFINDISKSAPEQSLWDTVRVWRDGRDSIFTEWNLLPANSPRRKQIRLQYEAFIFDLAQSNTYFADFANRYLVGDPMADIKEILGE